MDETLALPTDESVMIALRTQQIIAEESGVANVVDPFGGSYFMESLTNQVEREAMEYIRKIDEMGGIIKAIERGFPQAEIANSAYHFQRQLETKEKVMVGVNKYQADEKKRTLDTLYIDRSVEKRQVQKARRTSQTQAQRPGPRHGDAVSVREDCTSRQEPHASDHRSSQSLRDSAGNL